ncbi:MAG: PadR family transcriptional regulator [Anaerolineales bacterium]|nr:PadR family transcriptional regulator [Anaerolineales bacterium]NUQ85629.1 PadR family transcriptional regulator [Anaerolineales bacterium]
MKQQTTSPLTEATFFILLSLSPAPKHGYAIMKEVKALSMGRINFSTGTLYGAIRRLLEQGWIKRVADPEPNPTDRERKAYTLTDKGRRVVDAEVERLRSLLSTAEQRTSESAS